MTRQILVLLYSVIVLAACGGTAKLPVSAGTGPQPLLPETRNALVPLVNIADAKGWSPGATPVAASGLTVNAFAQGLDHPRWLYVLPNGDVLVAETNAQPKEVSGLRARIQKKVMTRAGAAVPSADRITLLRDEDRDGVAELKTVLLADLTSPFGMALVGGRLYVANTDGVVSVPYKSGVTEISALPVPLADLPGGPINHHWTKSLVASPDGKKLYAGIGSNSDHGENGMDNEVRRAAILEIDIGSGDTRVFAHGLRNPVGMAWEPETGVLWTAVNERDELGGDLVPDYMTSVIDGGFYGWPYSYYGDHLDPRIDDQRPDLVASARVPDYALGPHTASLGLTFAAGRQLGSDYGDGAFVGQHGSWNRKPRSGYKVIFVPFEKGKPAGMPRDVLTGFLDAKGDAQGRPVGVVIDKSGNLLVADDVGNTVWRVSRDR
ncbi:MAG: sorbosone dehydrogenase family protein [Woeseia sp.]|nr:sorbosone dehydrogenase family protein [Woeseia sp.]MBT8097553.1 sorbosone dehydrogenase family protein [Woeseia sp.]NNE61119.1 sorbosone dehydrogenase family protein [Woeseia sp.]NNL55722.1 sorbosone dehydrogenase family protein [Woeseia sp.]